MSGKTELRSRILYLVERYPGLHLREVQRQAGCSTMLAEYHLNVLERLGLVTSTRHGRYRDFFPVHTDQPPLDKARRRWLGLLRRPPILAATLALLEHGPLRQAELAQELDLAPSTLGYQVKVMRDAALVIEQHGPGRPRVALTDPTRTLELLRAYHPTPDLITEYGSLWSKVFKSPLAPAYDGEEALEADPDVPEALRGESRATVLVYLALRDGPLTQKEICEKTGHPRRTVYSALRQLQALGLVASQTDLRDARQSRFWILASDKDREHGSHPNQ